MKLHLYPILKFLEKLSVLKLFFIVIIFPTFMVLITISLSQQKGSDYLVTHEVFFDITVDGKPKGQFVMGLFGDIAPKTVHNFYILATTGIRGQKYQGTSFHRVIKKFMIQGGDVTHGEGVGRISIYGETFPDENFNVKHAAVGFVAMANSGPDSNACQFYITTASAPWLDDKHVVFGKVVEGQGIVHLIEHLDTDSSDRPISDVRIVKAGSRVLRRPYNITDNPYNLYVWLKTISIPMCLSLSIVLLFNHFMKKLDRGIQMEETVLLLKKKHLANEKRGITDDDVTQIGKGATSREGLRKRIVAANVPQEYLQDEPSNMDTDNSDVDDYLTKKTGDSTKCRGSRDTSA